MDVSMHNWSLKIEEGEVSMSLGNWSDAGWHWEDKGWENIPGFLWRIARSKVTDEFIEVMRSEGLDYHDIKPDVLPHVAQELYIVSGDNVEWAFGGVDIDTEMIEEDFREREGVSFDQMEKIIDRSGNFYDVTFEKFEKSGFADNITRMAQKVFEDSETFKELMDAINSEDMTLTIIENVINFKETEYIEALGAAKESLGY
jgi:hypothetical protein